MPKLVIVESPAKAKTISRFLGKDYKVLASFGHVRDLPSSAEEIPAEIKSKPWARFGVDIDNDFTAYYVIPSDSKKKIEELKRALKDADEVILATDEDREGESISWHLLEILKPKTPVKRIVFHEITQHAIDEALANPRGVNQELVQAQESRRVLDRLYGYSLSPVLWKKVRPKLSAGRVQSVAVRFVVEREEERRRFKASQYWDVEAQLEKAGVTFTAALVSLGGKRLATGKDFDPETGSLSSTEVEWLREADARKVSESLGAVSWTSVRVDQKETRLRPDPPFITSSLQRAASSLLGFAPKRTMQIAQRLYEGIELGGKDREGLITYMRTDSVVLSNEALSEAAKVIAARYGESYHQRRQFTTKSKMAQEAHEAIRPTKLSRTPDQVAAYLAAEDLKLYTIIWNRTIASQMADAQLLKTTVEFEPDRPVDGREAVLRSNGSVVTFPGFLKVADSSQKDTVLPDIKQGEKAAAGDNLSRAPIAIIKVEPVEHVTKPPARYTEASLIQRLEEEGIGRPSTYAPTLATIQQRGYVELKGKALVPTYLAIATTRLLKEHFGEYVDYGFTARMEDALDDIANGGQNAVAFLREFYRGNGHFGRGLERHIAEELPRIDFPVLPLGNDPETGEPIVVRIGRSAPFIQRGEGGDGNTVPIPADLTYEDLTVEHAAKLLRERARGDEPLGRHPETGEPIYALVGPFGPYVQLGERTEENKKPKRASLPKGMDPSQVDVALAVRLLSLPRELGKHPERGELITASVGRFGPYVKCGDDFRSLETGDDVYTVSFERALELLSRPKAARRSTKKILAVLGKDATDKPVELCEGRYGPYVTNGEVNASTPKNVDAASVTLEQALELLANAPAKKGTAKRKTAAKSKAKAKTKTRTSAKKKPAAKG